MNKHQLKALRIEESWQNVYEQQTSAWVFLNDVTSV